LNRRDALTSLPPKNKAGETMSGVSRRTVMALPVAAFMTARAARAAAAPIRIGVLNDQSSVFADSTGPGSVLSARLAAEEFTAQTGMAVEIIAADHQNKADTGSAIARDWFDRQGVDAVADLGNSAVALAVASVAREKDKACLVSAGGTTLLTGAQCAPTTVHWTYDTYSQSTALAAALQAEGRNTWFFITADYTFGQSLQDETTRAVQRLGGTVLGSVRHPINSMDFSAYLLQAQSSGAKVIALANGGDDTARCAKQAREFGLTATQTLAGLSMMITDAHAIGLEAAQGLLVTEAFYWDLNNGTRAFSASWSARNRGREPTMMQAGVYGVVLHYLKAVHALGSAGSGAAVVRRMKAMPTDDAAFGRGTIRADGRAIHDNYVFQIKTPQQSHSEWDIYNLVHTVPGDVAFRPIDQGGCPLLAEMAKG
jgi:branched-chain amino acid transport system substrate-binding protein